MTIRQVVEYQLLFYCKTVVFSRRFKREIYYANRYEFRNTDRYKLL